MSPLIFFLYSSQIQSFRFSVLTPSPWGHSPYIVAPHPAMLRDTAGGEVAIWFYCCCCRSFLTPPFFGHLPYILLCTTQGRRIATQSFSLYCFVAPRNATGRGRGEVAIWFYCCCCRSFLTPPFFGHLPYILLCTTQGRRIATQSFSLYCFVAPRNAAGHGRGRDCDLILLLLLSLFFNPSVLRTPPLYFTLQNTGEEDWKAAFFPILFCSAP